MAGAVTREERDQMVALYRRGMSANKIAVKCRRSRQTVAEQLMIAGVVSPPRPPGLTDAQIAAVAGSYGDDGLSLAKCAAEHDLARKTVKAALLFAGVGLRYRRPGPGDDDGDLAGRRAPSPAAARLYGHLCSHAGPLVDVGAAAAAAAIDPGTAPGLLDELAEVGLLRQAEDGWYRWPETAAQMDAVDCRGATECDPVRAAALSRVLAYRLTTAAAAAHAVTPYRQVLAALSERAPQDTPTFDAVTGLAQLEHDRIALMHAIRAASAHQQWETTIGYGEVMQVLFSHLGYIGDEIEVAGFALHAARQLGDQRTAGRFHDRRGTALAHAGRLEEAEVEVLLGRATWRDTHDERRRAGSLRLEALIAVLRGDHDTALDLYLEALSIYRGFIDRRHIAVTTLYYTSALISAGRADEAMPLLHGNCHLLIAGGGPWDHWRVHLQLGSAQTATGDLPGAERNLREALTGMRALGATAGVADALEGLAAHDLAAGDLEVARGGYRQALDLLKDPAGLQAQRIGHALSALPADRAGHAPEPPAGGGGE